MPAILYNILLNNIYMEYYIYIYNKYSCIAL